jgi:hypothetical protein
VTSRVVVSGSTKATDLLGRRLVGYGHSYIAADSQNQPGWRQIDQVAIRMNASRVDNYASGGDTTSQCLDLVRATWNHDAEAVVLIDITQNDMRVYGTDAAGQEQHRAYLTRILDHLRDAYAVLLIEQVWLNQVDYDYVLATYGVVWSDPIIDAFNAINAEVVAAHPNAQLVRLNDRGHDRQTMNLVRHPTDEGMIFTAWQVDTVAAGIQPVPALADPLTDPRALGWRACFWADDPDWAKPADGAPVTSWHDGSGNGWHATQATPANQPTFDASNPAFNGHASVHFSGAQWLVTGDFGTLYQPNTIVAILRTAAGATMNIVDGIDGVNHRQLLRKIGITGRRITSKSPSIDDTHPDDNGTHLWLAVFDDITLRGVTVGQSFIEIDGTETIRGHTGGQELTGLTIGTEATAHAQPMTGDITFLGARAGIISEAELNLLEAWAADYYTIPVTPDPVVVIDPVDPPDIPGELADLPWHVAFFASGDWDHPADGGLVDAWPDSSGNGRDLVQATARHQPVFDAAGANGKACIRFSGDQWLAGGDWPVLAQPSTMILVAFTDTATTQTLIDGWDANHRRLLKQVGVTNHRMYAGGILDDAIVPDRGLHLYVAVWNGASSRLDIDGQTVATGNAGTHALNGLTLGASYFGIDDHLRGGVSLAGVLPGVISAGDLATIEALAEDFYGIPIT